MADLDIIPIGVGDTFSERYVTTALLLQCQGFSLAVDCPDRYRGALREAAAMAGRPLALPGIDHVLITHVHGDHMNGLEGVAFWKRFAEGRRLNLITSDEVRSVIWDQRLRAPMESLWDGQSFRTLSFDDYFDHQVLPWDRPIEVGPLTIRSYRTIHHVPTSALLIEAGGHTLGYSSDTAFDPNLIAFLGAADLIIHETNYGPAHTAYSDLCGLPTEIKAKMRLIHYSDQFDVAASEIRVAKQGEVLRVSVGP